MSQVIYDIETYPNCFLLGLEHMHSDYKVMFECSDRRDDSVEMFALLRLFATSGVEMIGFNNVGFDYPVVHALIRKLPEIDAVALAGGNVGAFIAKLAYDKAQMIIGGGDRFANTIWASDRFIPQIDLFKMNHFDNVAKATSLKVLQFTMRSESVEDLPIEPGTILTPEQIDTTRIYCGHDISETKRFAHRNTEEIAFRRSLNGVIGDDVMNWSDVKIGAEFMISRLGKKVCYYYDENNKRQPRQTPRSSIAVAPLIFPYIKFERRECRELLERFKALVITNTKAAISDAVELNGFTFAFGAGGVHGSVDKRAFHASADSMIIDADVTSLYPSLAIENRLYPEHLGEAFCDQYGDLKTERVRHAKGTPMNAALKLALNGTYGNSNNPWSCFYDPQYTMTTTINGQFSLLMLAERLLDGVPGLQLIQINTDGVTFSVNPGNRSMADAIMRQWERETRLTLEFAQYAAFFCRDVNNYLAVGVDGKVKAKGAYFYPKKEADYNGWWHKDWSAMVVQKAVEAALVKGADVAQFIAEHTDPFDFMCRFKCPRDSKLMWGDEAQQRVTRYFMSTAGRPLVKTSPPPPGASLGDYKRKSKITDAEYYGVLRSIPPGTWDERIHTKNQSRYEQRAISVAGNAGICNRASDFDWSTLDREWYITEARKLVDCFKA